MVVFTTRDAPMGETSSSSNGYRVLYCQPADCYYHVRRRLRTSSPLCTGQDPDFWL